jgi:phage-related protein
MAKESARKPLFWLHDTTIQTPPFSKEARVEAGTLLRRIQEGELLAMPHSRPMPSIGKKCHEVRVRDENRIWRVVYRVDSDAIVVAAVFSKTTQATPQSVISQAKARLRLYDDTVKFRQKGLKNE